jgi:hypothetical protein
MKLKEHMLEMWLETCSAIKIFINKMASRKFVVFCIATHMTYASILASDNWLFVALVFLGIQGATDWKIQKPTPTEKIPSTDNP